MVNTVDFTTILKWALVMGIVEALFPLLYFYIRGVNMKKRFGLHSNRWFSLGVMSVKLLVIYIPMYYGMSAFLMLPMILFTYLALQAISDDYIHSF